ncbi:hypothetical protein Hanom_Chr12g01094121 [Helianthus anomalus]
MSQNLILVKNNKTLITRKNPRIQLHHKAASKNLTHQPALRIRSDYNKIKTVKEKNYYLEDLHQNVLINA